MEKYFITCDLESTSEFSSNIKPLISEQLDSIRNNISYLINDTFNDGVCEIVKYNNIQDFFLSKRTPDDFIISLENGIYIQGADFNFDSTRLYYSKEDVINFPKNYSIMTRDGNDLSSQIKNLVLLIEKSQKNNIVICDDGIFSGDTLIDVLKLLKKNGINVSELRVILNFSGKDNLGGINIDSMYSQKKCKDWIDERDFFYGVNMSGASFSYNGKINGLPYIHNKEILEKKASIPKIKSKEFRENLILQNIDFWEKISFINGLDITLKDINRISYLEEVYEKDKNIIDLLYMEMLNF